MASDDTFEDGLQRYSMGFAVVTIDQQNTTLRKWTAFVLMALGLTAAIYLFLSSGAAHAKSALGKAWPVSRRVSMDDVDHSSLDELLTKYVDEDGYVDYSGWKASPTDRKKLQRYFDELSHADTAIPARRESQLAFWINAYNAVTLEGILRVYPTASIRDHTSAVGGYNIWKHLPLRVGDESHSLEQIEHDILRPMGEPRIHFAIVCASVGCPRLLDEAYTAESLEEQLASNTRDFFRRGRNLRVDANGRTLYLSSILNWFGEDFGKTQADRLAYISLYLPDDAATAVKQSTIEVEYLDYDWSLNDQTRRP